MLKGHLRTQKWPRSHLARIDIAIDPRRGTVVAVLHATNLFLQTMVLEKKLLNVALPGLGDMLLKPSSQSRLANWCIGRARSQSVRQHMPLHDAMMY